MSCRAAAKRHHFHRALPGVWRCGWVEETGCSLPFERSDLQDHRGPTRRAASTICINAPEGCQRGTLYLLPGDPGVRGHVRAGWRPAPGCTCRHGVQIRIHIFPSHDFSPSVCPPNAQVAAVLFARVVHGLVVTAVPGPHDPRHRPTVLAAVPRLQCQAQQNSSTNSLATVPRTSVHSCRVRLSPNVSQLLRRSHPPLSCGR